MSIFGIEGELLFGVRLLSIFCYYKYTQLPYVQSIERMSHFIEPCELVNY